MQHFYDSFALVSQICVRRDALTLFGLNDDELLPDLHITGAGVLRTGLGARQEHRFNHDAQAADRTKVPAEVIQVAAHEVDSDSDKAESVVATSGSEGSESASDSEQNDPPSSLASDAEQYERMQASYVGVGRDFHDQENFIGSEYRKLQRLELVPERWPWQGSPSPCKNVLTILTVFWLGVAGRSMQHGQTPKNRCLPFAKCLNA